MLSHEEATQAFVKAIKTVGLENFKKTSVFISNHKSANFRTESEAA